MNQIKKYLSIAVLSAAAFIFSNRISTAAAEIPSADITIDYDNQKLTVQENTAQNKDLQIYVAVPSMKTVKQKNDAGVTVKNKVLAASAWDSYDYDPAKGVDIDLSWINRKKDTYLQIKGNQNADPVTIKFPAALLKVSAVFDPVNATVSMQDITNKKQPVVIKDQAIEYKVPYGKWKTYNGIDGELSMYQVRGASLEFRLAAHDKESLNVTDPVPETAELFDAAGKGILIYEAGNFPGIEKKVKIKKRAASPKAVVDYAKHQFKLSANTEYRVLSQTQKSAWTDFTDPTSRLKLSDLKQYITGDTAILETRKKAAASNSHSASSKLEFAMPSVLPVFTTSPNVSPNQIVESDIIYNSVGSSEDDCDIYVSYVYKESTKQLTGIQFSNTTTQKYEVFISKNGVIPEPDAAVHTIRAKASENDKDAETFISTKYVTIGDKIYIRKKANTKTKEWSSYFAGLGKIDFNSTHVK